MTRKILYPLLLTAAALFAGCNNKVVIDDERTFANDVWNRFTPEVFDIDIDNTDNYYNIDFSVSIDTAHFRYSSMPFTVNIYSPTGERRMFYTTIYFKDKGRWNGEPAADGYYVFSNRIRSYFSFNSRGTNKIEVAQATSQYDLEGVHSLGVYIEKTSVDYDNL